MSTSAHAEGEPVPGIVLVKISADNKTALLKDATTYALEGQPETELVLKNLHQVNSPIVEQLQHKSIALEKLTLRMLCSAVAAKAEVPTYLVVSYCWPNPGWVPAPAAQPLTDWGLSRPIVQKILSLRNSNNEGIWVDRRCIDQKSAEEKEIAIGAMDVVYRAARRLAIALEDVQLGDEELVAVKYSHMYQDMCRAVKERERNEGKPLEQAPKVAMVAQLFKFDDQDLDFAGQFLLKLVNARWFSRAWCAHEIKVNPHNKEHNPIFLCFGKDGNVLDFEFRFIHYLATILIHKRKQKPYSGTEFFDEIDATTQVNTLLRCHQTIDGMMPDRNSKLYLVQYLVSMSGFGCEVKDDLISIALNAGRIPFVFRHSLSKSTNSVKSSAVDRPELRYFVFALMALMSGDLRPLLLNARALEILDPGKQRKSVSWVDLPHNSSTEERLPALATFTNYIHAVCLEYIELDIYLFRNTPQKASEKSLSQAQAIIDKHSLAIRHEAGVVAEANVINAGIAILEPNNLEKKTLVEFLASSIDNGLAWMLRLPSILEAQTSSNNWWYGTFDFSSTESNAPLIPIAMELLSNLGITPEHSAAQSDPTTLSFESKFLSPMLRFLAVITDPRLCLTAVTPCRIRTFPPDTSNSASEDFAFTTSISDHSYIAVPVCLAHLPFWEQKAWVIEPGAEPWVPDWSWKLSLETGPADVDVTDILPVMAVGGADRRAAYTGEEGAPWNLRKRQPLVGCGELVADGDAVRLLKRQRIYGGRDYDWAGMTEKMKEWPANWQEYIRD